MPLLGRKIFDCGNSATIDDKPGNQWHVPHTKEAFSSQEEYDKRLTLYNKNIWFCQCTGHGNLTHMDAHKSEQISRERLAKLYLEVWEEPVLELVQHSYSSLESIIGQAQTLLQTNLVKNEKVSFTVKPGKVFDATIVKRHALNPAPVTTPDQGAVSDVASSPKRSPSDNGLPPSISPSSDKENKSRQTLITDIFKTDMRRSPRCPAKSNVLAKTKKLAMIPAKYDILLTNENKIISKVPSEHLTRVDKPPNRELIRLFIRSNSIRPFNSKQKNPWIVDEDMVFRYSLKPRIGAERERKIVQSGTVTYDQYVRGDVPAVELAIVNGNHDVNGDVVSDDDCAEIAETDKSLSPPPKMKRKVDEPTAASKKRAKRDNLTIAKNRNNNAKGLEVATTKTPSADFFKQALAHTIAKAKSEIKKQDDEKLRAALASKKAKKKSDEKSRKISGSLATTKKKQATLTELNEKKRTTKHEVPQSPSARQPWVAKSPRQPIVVLQLLSLKKEKVFRSHKYKMTVTTASRILTEKQRENLPPEVKDDVVKRWNKIAQQEMRRKFKSMTPEERKAYIATRRKERRQKRKEEEGAGAEGESTKPKGSERFEDRHLVRCGQCKILPNFPPVVVGADLPNSAFGSVAMLCEFIYSYNQLLSPRDPTFYKRFNFRTITDAVTAGRTGFKVTGRILVLLLETLLLDDIAKDYKELDFHLKKLQVRPETCCELTRICLRQHDDDDNIEAEDGDHQCETGLGETTSRRLFEVEIYDMSAGEQLEVMCALVYRVVNTYAVQLHMDDMQQKHQQVRNKILAQKKQEKKEMLERGIVEPPKKRGRPKADEPNAHETTAETGKKSAEEDLGIDLVSRVKKRKMMSEQRKREEEERKRKRREENERLADEEKKRAEVEKADRQLEETRTIVRQLHRRVPLGTDRNHHRYWLLCDGVPGLYVERGWASEHSATAPDHQALPSTPVKLSTPYKSAAKCNGTPQKKGLNDSDDDDIPLSVIAKDDVPLNHLLATPSKATRFRKSREETSWPTAAAGDDVTWMSIDSQQDLDNLMSALSRHGIRESQLRDALRKNYDAILRSFKKKQVQSERPADQAPARRSTLPSDGDELHRQMARKNLLSLVQESARGGLADFSDLEMVEQQVALLDDAKGFAQVLLDVHRAVPAKFLRHYMTGMSDRKRKPDQQQTGDDEDPARTTETRAAERRVARWRHAVQQVTLFSRFNFLLAILHDSIKWELYRYRRTNVRRAARDKSYADEGRKEDDNDVDVEEASGGEESSSGDDDDVEHRRSSRLRQKKSSSRRSRSSARATGCTSDAFDNLRQRRTRRRPTRYQEDASASDGEEESEEEDEEQADGSDEDVDVEDADKDEASSQEDEENEEEESSEEEIDEADVCKKIVERMMRYQFADIFCDPVDEGEVPDYYQVIARPICLREIADRVTDAKFTFATLVDDVRLMLDNAREYNGPGSRVVRQAERFEHNFVRVCQASFRSSPRHLDTLRKF